MKSKPSIKTRIIYMFTSNFGRITLAGIFIFLGGILGTDGLLERENQSVFWDYVMYFGVLVWLIYTIFGFYYAIKNLISDIKGE